MKKILSLVAIASLSLGYEGCGIDKKEALNALSQSIYVNVNNKFQKKEKLTLGIFDSFDKNVESETTQTSNLTLKNVKYINKNGEVCAVVSKKDVEDSAKSELKILKNFKLSNLPQNFKDKQKTIATLLNKINFVKAVLKLDANTLNKLTSLEKQLKDAANEGEIIFNTNLPNATIKIAGINKEFKPSTPILLPAGEYSYEISAPDKCPITGKFIVKAKESFTINKDLEDYPVITFTSNQKNVNVRLNGSRIALNTPKTIKKCDSKAVWSMAFEDQVESGEIELKPGLKETINQDFTPRLAMKKLKEKVKYYTHSKEVTISYGYAVTNEDEDEWDSEKRIEVRQFNNYGIYKLGFGILAGTKTNWTARDMNELEVAISARVQLPEIADTTLHIYRMPIIPYIGVEGGWDIYKFIDKFSNYDINNITSIIRGTVGITFLLHKQFGFNVEYSHDVLEKRDHVFTAGIVMDF